MTDTIKSGFVTLAGRPNVGKSTLLNRLVGSKVAITSPRPQTTRNRIVGVMSRDEFQIVFVDTPGIMREKSRLNKMMIETSVRSGGESDILLFLSEAEKVDVEGDNYALGRLNAGSVRKILVINKIDAVKKKELLPIIATLKDISDFEQVFPISARSGEGVDEMVRHIVGILPEGPRFYPDDMLTDQPESFYIAELIREKAFMALQQELPYSTAVVVEQLVDQPNGVTLVAAIIYVERESQKAIVIGKGGAMIKKIGAAARLELERRMETRIYLDLHVKVKDRWTADLRSMSQMGYVKE